MDSSKLNPQINNAPKKDFEKFLTTLNKNNNLYSESKPKITITDKTGTSFGNLISNKVQQNVQDLKEEIEKKFNGFSTNKTPSLIPSFKEYPFDVERLKKSKNEKTAEKAFESAKVEQMKIKIQSIRRYKNLFVVTSTVAIYTAVGTISGGLPYILLTGYSIYKYSSTSLQLWQALEDTYIGKMSLNSFLLFLVKTSFSFALTISSLGSAFGGLTLIKSALGGNFDTAASLLLDGLGLYSQDAGGFAAILKTGLVMSFDASIIWTFISKDEIGLTKFDKVFVSDEKVLKELVAQAELIKIANSLIEDEERTKLSLKNVNKGISSRRVGNAHLIKSITLEPEPYEGFFDKIHEFVASGLAFTMHPIVNQSVDLLYRSANLIYDPNATSLDNFMKIAKDYFPDLAKNVFLMNLIQGRLLAKNSIARKVDEYINKIPFDIIDPERKQNISNYIEQKIGWTLTYGECLEFLASQGFNASSKYHTILHQEALYRPTNELLYKTTTDEATGITTNIVRKTEYNQFTQVVTIKTSITRTKKLPLPENLTDEEKKAYQQKNPKTGLSADDVIVSKVDFDENPAQVIPKDRFDVTDYDKYGFVSPNLLDDKGIKFFLIAELETAKLWLNAKGVKFDDWMHYLFAKTIELKEDDYVKREGEKLAKEYQKIYNGFDDKEQEEFQNYMKKLALDNKVDTSSWPDNWFKNPTYTIRLWNMLSPEEISKSLTESKAEKSISRIFNFHNNELQKANISSKEDQAKFWTEKYQNLPEEQKTAIDSILNAFWHSKSSSDKHVPVTNEEIQEFITFGQNNLGLSQLEKDGYALMLEIRNSSSQRLNILTTAIYPESQNMLDQDYETETEVAVKQNISQALGDEKLSEKQLKSIESNLIQDEVQQNNLKKETQFVDSELTRLDSEKSELDSQKFNVEKDPYGYYTQQQVSEAQNRIEVGEAIANNFHNIDGKEDTKEFLEESSQKKLDEQKFVLKNNFTKTKNNRELFVQRLKLIATDKVANKEQLKKDILFDLFDQILTTEEKLSIAENLAYNNNLLNDINFLIDKLSKYQLDFAVVDSKTFNRITPIRERLIEIKNSLLKVNTDVKSNEAIDEFRNELKESISNMILIDKDLLEKFLLGSEENGFVDLPTNPALLTNLLKIYGITKPILKLPLPDLNDPKYKEKLTTANMINLISDIQVILLRGEKIPQSLYDRYDRYLADYNLTRNFNDDKELAEYSFKKGISILPPFKPKRRTEEVGELIEQTDEMDIYWLNLYNISVLNGEPDVYSFQKYLDTGNPAKNQKLEFGTIIHPSSNPNFKNVETRLRKDNPKVKFYATTDSLKIPTRLNFLQPPYPDFLLDSIRLDYERMPDSAEKTEILEWLEATRTNSSFVISNSSVFDVNQVTNTIEALEEDIRQFHLKKIPPTKEFEDKILYLEFLYQSRELYQKKPTFEEKIEKYSPSVKPYPQKYSLSENTNISFTYNNYLNAVSQLGNIEETILFNEKIIAYYTDIAEKTTTNKLLYIFIIENAKESNISLKKSSEILKNEINSQLDQNEKIYNQDKMVETNTGETSMWQLKPQGFKIIEQIKFTIEIPGKLNNYVKEIMDKTKINPYGIVLSFTPQELLMEIDNFEKAESKNIPRPIKDSLISQLKELSSNVSSYYNTQTKINNITTEVGGNFSNKPDTEIVKPVIRLKTIKNEFIVDEKTKDYTEFRRREILAGDISLFLDQNAETLIRKKFNIPNDKSITLIDLEKYCISTGIIVDGDEFLVLLKTINSIGFKDERRFFKEFYNRVFYRALNYQIKSNQIKQSKSFFEKRKVELTLASQKINVDKQKDLDVFHALVFTKNKLVNQRNLIRQRKGYSQLSTKREFDVSKASNKQTSLIPKLNEVNISSSNKDLVQNYVDLDNLLSDEKTTDNDFQNFMKERLNIDDKSLTKKDAEFIIFQLKTRIESIDKDFFKKPSNEIIYTPMDSNPKILNNWKNLNPKTQLSVLQLLGNSNFISVEATVQNLNTVRGGLSQEEQKNFDLFINELVSENPQPNNLSYIYKTLALNSSKLSLKLRNSTIKTQLSKPLLVIPKITSRFNATQHLPQIILQLNGLNLEQYDTSLTLAEFTKKYPDLIPTNLVNDSNKDFKVENLLEINQTFSEDDVDLTVYVTKLDDEKILETSFNELSVEITNLENKINARKKILQRDELKSHDTKIVGRRSKILSIRGSYQFIQYAQILKPIVSKSRNESKRDISSKDPIRVYAPEVKLIETKKIDENGKEIVERKFVKLTLEEKKQYVMEKSFEYGLQGLNIPKEWYDADGNIDFSKINFDFLTNIGEHIGGYQFETLPDDLGSPFDRQKVWFQWILNPYTGLKEKRYLETEFESQLVNDLQNYNNVLEIMNVYIDAQISIDLIDPRDVYSELRSRYLREPEVLAHMRSPFVIVSFLRSQNKSFTLNTKDPNNFAPFDVMRNAMLELISSRETIDNFNKKYENTPEVKTEEFKNEQKIARSNYEAIQNFNYLTNLEAAINAKSLDKTMSVETLGGNAIYVEKEITNTKTEFSILCSQFIELLVDVDYIGVKPPVRDTGRNGLAFDSSFMLDLYQMLDKNTIEQENLENFLKQTAFENFDEYYASLNLGESKKSALQGHKIGKENGDFLMKVLKTKTQELPPSFKNTTQLLPSVINDVKNITKPEDIEVVKNILIAIPILLKNSPTDNSEKDLDSIIRERIDTKEYDKLSPAIKQALKSTKYNQIGEIYAILNNQQQVLILETTIYKVDIITKKFELKFTSEDAKKAFEKKAGEELSKKVLTNINDPNFVDFMARQYNLINNVYCVIQKQPTCTFPEFKIEYILENSDFWYRFNYVNEQVFALNSTINDSDIQRNISSTFQNFAGLKKIQDFVDHSSTDEKKSFIESSRTFSNNLKKVKSISGAKNDRALAIGFSGGDSFFKRIDNQSYFETAWKWIFNDPDSDYVQSPYALFDAQISSQTQPVRESNAVSLYYSPIASKYLGKDLLAKPTSGSDSATFAAYIPFVGKNDKSDEEVKRTEEWVKFNAESMMAINERPALFVAWLMNIQKSSADIGNNKSFNILLAKINIAMVKGERLILNDSENFLFEELFTKFEDFYIQVEHDLLIQGGTLLRDAVRKGQVTNYLGEKRKLPNQNFTTIIQSMFTAFGKIFQFFKSDYSLTKPLTEQQGVSVTEQLRSQYVNSVIDTTDAYNQLGTELDIANSNPSYNSFESFKEKGEVANSFYKSTAINQTVTEGVSLLTNGSVNLQEGHDNLTGLTAYFIFLNEVRVGTTISVSYLFTEQLLSGYLYQQTLSPEQKKAMKENIKEYEKDKNQKTPDEILLSFKNLPVTHPLYVVKPILELALELKKDEIAKGGELTGVEQQGALARISDKQWLQKLAPEVRKTIMVGPHGSKSRLFYDLFFYKTFIQPNQELIKSFKISLDNIEKNVDKYLANGSDTNSEFAKFISNENRNLKLIPERPKKDGESDFDYNNAMIDIRQENDNIKGKIITDVRNSYYKGLENEFRKFMGDAQLNFLKESLFLEKADQDLTVKDLNDEKALQLSRIFRLTMDAYMTDLIVPQVLEYNNSNRTPWEIKNEKKGLTYEIKPSHVQLINNTLPISRHHPIYVDTEEEIVSFSHKGNVFTNQGLKNVAAAPPAPTETPNEYVKYIKTFFITSNPQPDGDSIRSGANASYFTEPFIPFYNSDSVYGFAYNTLKQAGFVGGQL